MKNGLITSRRLFREVPLALAYTTMWCVALWVVNYPADERVGVAVIAYIALWVSREVIGNLTVALLRSLREYGLRTAKRAGIEISDAEQGQRGRGANAVVVLFLLAVVATILGCSLVPTTFIASWVGLTQLNPYFAIAGLGMLTIGICALALFFLIPLTLFAKIETLHKVKDLSAGISRIEESELIVQRRLGVQASSS